MVKEAVDTNVVQAGESAEPSEAVETKATETETEASEVKSDGDDAADKGEAGEKDNNSDPFPKKAVNALNRAKREKRQLRAQVKALEAELVKLRNGVSADPLKAPDPKDFESYTDLLDAKTDYKIKKEMLEANKSRQVEALEAQKQQIVAQRYAEVSAVAAETAKEIPDLQQVIAAQEQVFANVDPAIEDIITDLDNPSLAVYVLAKEGVLSDVLGMTPALAAAHLLNAQQRGEQFLHSQRAKKVTSAPDPMRGAKGTGVATKSLHERSPEELLKWVRS